MLVRKPKYSQHLGDLFFVKTIFRIATFCLLLLTLSIAHAQAPGGRTIFLVRHADKISDAPDAMLSDEGHRRAACLAKMLADADIQQIYTSDLQRTQQTAAPLAQQRQLKPVVIPLSKPEDLIEAIKSGTAANVLVVWHGGTLPQVLHALGAPEVSPISDAEYNRFYILTLAQNKDHAAVNFTALRYCDPEK
jgi:broad specificity phosphatase PhoE